MDGVEYRQVGLSHPFITVPPTAAEWRLYVVRGEGVALECPDIAPADSPLQNGAIIGMAGDAPHRFMTTGVDPGLLPEAVWDERGLGRISPSDKVLILVSRIPQASLPFLSMIGGFIRIDPGRHGEMTARIGLLMDLIAEETVRNDPVTGEIVLRLAEIITIEIGRVGRAHSVLFRNRPEDAEYDGRIWRAITAICGEPHRRWTVESMAKVAGMSRSAFAARYQKTVGQTPMLSLRRLRMHRAAIALATHGTRSIAPLADEMGYGSDAAFNRAFTKEFGYPPKRYGLAKADELKTRTSG